MSRDNEGHVSAWPMPAQDRGQASKFSIAGKTIWIAGHNGMVGRALVHRLARENCRILTVDRRDLDLTDQAPVASFLHETRPDAIVVAAARVGGILANSEDPVGFLTDNLSINLNIARAAHAADVERVLFLGSSCIYPRLAPQPISEDALLGGALEPTNQWYAIAKIAAAKLAEAYNIQFGRHYISAMPTNLYGPGDNFDLNSSHVVPALLRKAHEAKVSGAGRLHVWGTGRPRREFLHVEDCADALLLLLQTYSDPQPINVGFGEDVALADLARIVASIVGFEGEIVFDPGKPDGTPRKLLDSSKLQALGWRPRIGLRDGLAQTYAWYAARMAREAAA